MKSQNLRPLFSFSRFTLIFLVGSLVSSLRLHAQTPLSLINLDFGGGTSLSKVGFAVTGQTSYDTWNYCKGGTTVNLILYANGPVTGTRVSVTGSSLGSYGNGAADPMYNSYLYTSSGNITVTVSNLSGGTYNFYIYGHGAADNQNSTYQVNVGSQNEGSLTTLNGPGWNSSSPWQLGLQYVEFSNVVVAAGQTVTVTVSPGAGGYAVIAGMQIALLPPPCTPPPANLVSWWQAEDNALDLTGANNGTLVGGVTFVPGEVGQAFSFTGSNSAVSVGNPADLQLQNLTIEAWVKLASTNISQDSLIFSYGTLGYGFGVSHATGNLFLSQIDLSGQENYAGLTDTKWHHVAVTKNGGTVFFYIDGVASSPAAYNPSFLFARSAAIGARGDNYGNGFNGSIDELSVYSRALAPSEVQAIYNAASTGKCTNTPPIVASGPASQGAPIGANVSLSVNVIGFAPLSYQWQFNGTNLTGATNSTLALTNVQVGDSGNYDVVVSNASGSATSSNAVLIVGIPPTAMVQPGGITAPPGTTATFSVIASGDSPLAYQWNFNGNSISGATDSSLVLRNVQFSQSGSYTITVTNAFGSVTSSPATLTVEMAPVITQQPLNSTNFVGANVTFSVTANGTLPLAYQWTFNGNSISGATGNSLVLTDVQYSQAGTYGVVVSNVYGLTISSNATLTVVTPPPCVPGPSSMVAWWPGEGNALDASLNVNNGTLETGASFAPGEVGQAFSFAPGNSGIKIPASSSLLVGQFDNYHDVYFAIDAWIKPADISTPQPIIQWNDGSGLALWISVNSPGSLYVSYGQGNVSFSSPPGLIDTNSFHHVAVASAGFANCRLFVDGVPVATNSSISQATTSGEVTLGFSPPSSSFAGLIDEVSVYSYISYDQVAPYFQSVYNAGSVGRCGRSLPGVTAPADQAVLAGTNVSLGAGVASSSPCTFQWQFNGTNIPGANGNPLTLTNVQPLNTGAYTVLVSNPFGSVTSASANLTVITTPISITTQPASQTVTTGNDAKFSVVASGSGPYSYQWQFQGTDIAGATGSSYTVNAQPATSGAYAVLVSNPASSILSSNASLSLQAAVCYPPPSGLVAWWPADGDAKDIIGGNDGTMRGAAGFGPGKVGQDFTFASSGYVSVSDSTNWSFGTNDFSIELWASFNGIQSDNFFIGHDERASGGANRWSFGLNRGILWFQVNSVSSVGSSPFTPTLGTYYHIAVTQTGGVYTFYVNGAPMSSATNSTPVSGAQTPLTLGQSGGQGYLNGQLDEISIYNRALSPSEILGIYTAGSAGKCESAAAPVMTSQPADQTVTAGANVTFSAQVASLLPLSCQWYFNYAPVSGATNLSLTLFSVSTAQAGLYQLVASNGLGSVTSRVALLTVLPNTNINNGQPIIAVQPQSRMYMACDAATLSVTATGNGPFHYQWYLNGTPVGGNSPTLTLPGISPTCAGTYDVVVSNSAGSVTSSNAVISIVPGSLNYFNNFSGGGLSFVSGTQAVGTTSDPSAPSPPTVALVDQVNGYVGLGGSPVNIGLNTSSGGTLGFWVLLPDIKFTVYSDVLTAGGGTNANPLPVGAVEIASISDPNYSETPSPTWTYVSGDIPPAIRSPGQTWFAWWIQFNPYGYTGTAEIDDVTISSFLPPMMLTQLQDQTAFTGQTVVFSVVAVGDHSMTYQWQFDGTNLHGATTSTLTLPNVTTNQSGAYGVLVSNSLGSLLSPTVTLTVNPAAAVIDSQPQAQIAAYGSNATLTVVAEGAGPLSYQWQFDGVNISGATNSFLTLNNFQLSEVGNYRVIISNSLGSVTSAVATIDPLPGPFTLTPSASGSMLNMQWPAAASGFIVETTTSLTTPATWVTVTNVPVVNGTNNVMSLPMTNASGYYRLRHP